MAQQLQFTYQPIKVTTLLTIYPYSGNPDKRPPQITKQIFEIINKKNTGIKFA